MTAPRKPRAAREPIRRWWLWLAILGILLVGVPWYLPAGHIGRTFVGIPVWFWVSILSAVALSAITCYACLTQWNLEDSDEFGTNDLRDTKKVDW